MDRVCGVGRKCAVSGESHLYYEAGRAVQGEKVCDRVSHLEYEETVCNVRSVQYHESYICSARTEFAVRAGEIVEVKPSPDTAHKCIHGDSADHKTFVISSNSPTVQNLGFSEHVKCQQEYAFE